jgi:hypothetical protein
MNFSFDFSHRTAKIAPFPGLSSRKSAAIGEPRQRANVLLINCLINTPETFYSKKICSFPRRFFNPFWPQPRSKNTNLLLEGAFVLLDLLPGELVELGVDVNHPVADFDFVAVVQSIVDFLSPDQDRI